MHPGGVNTVMGHSMMDLGVELGAGGEYPPLSRASLPVRMSEPVDISNAVLYLASEESRHVTGHEIIVDGGANV